MVEQRERSRGGVGSLEWQCCQGLCLLPAEVVAVEFRTKVKQAKFEIINGSVCVLSEVCSVVSDVWCGGSKAVPDLRLSREGGTRQWVFGGVFYRQILVDEMVLFWV